MADLQGDCDAARSAVVLADTTPRPRRATTARKVATDVFTGLTPIG